MKGVFQARGVTFAIDAEYISEVIQCEKISPLITSNKKVLGTVTIRDVAVPIITITEYDESKEPLVLVIEKENSEIGVVIDSVLGLYDFSTSTRSTCRTTAIGSTLYYNQAIGENIISLDIENIFLDSDMPAMEKRQFEKPFEKNGNENSDSYLVMQSCSHAIN